jgi:hypothetical protein
MGSLRLVACAEALAKSSRMKGSVAALAETVKTSVKTNNTQNNLRFITPSEEA